MAICTDCIHFDVCRDATIPNPEYKGPVADKSKECRHFKNKADFEEVKHGRWIDIDPLEWDCSVCGYSVKRWNSTTYCPHCGAKMDGIKEE